MKRLVAMAAALFAASAAAQFPQKPVKVLVPFPAGSATDTITRIITAPMAQTLGQPVVVEAKAGADGAIAAAEVAKAPPDGHTLLMATNSPLSAVPTLRKSPPYDALRDFTPISLIGNYTFFIVTHPSIPAKTLAELVTHVRANPGKINYATGNTTGIVSTAYFASLNKLDMVHVPYKGEPPAMTDLVGGRIQMMFASSSTSVPHVRDGRLKALATTLNERSHLLPDVPAIGEAGFPGFPVVPWAGVVGPAKMPREVVERLNREFVAALKRPEVLDGLKKQAFVPISSSADEFGTYIRQQLEIWGKTIREAGIQPE
jgi:tripartite-type tricarboxylate transporter receptor subunit TctC